MDGPRDPSTFWLTKAKVPQYAIDSFCAAIRDETYKAFTRHRAEQPLARTGELRRSVRDSVRNNVTKNTVLQSTIGSLILAWLIKTVLTYLIDYIIDQLLEDAKQESMQ